MAGRLFVVTLLRDLYFSASKFSLFDVFDAEVREALGGLLQLVSRGRLILGAVAAHCNTEIRHCA